MILGTVALFRFPKYLWAWSEERHRKGSDASSQRF